MNLRIQRISRSRHCIGVKISALTLLLAFPAAVSAAFALGTPCHSSSRSCKASFAVATVDHKLWQRRDESSDNSVHRQTSLKYKNHVDDSSISGVGAVVKHPLFLDKNVHVQHFPVDSLKTWESILPQVDVLASMFGIGGGRQLRRGVIGKDVTVEFEEARDGAKKLLEGCGLNEETEESVRMMAQLTRVLSFYQGIVSYGQGDKMELKCKARIVSTRGHVGTKCPRWHADHVPVRLVMSLIGPGCDYIPETQEESETVVLIDREALNGLDLDDTAAANRIIVPNEEGIVHSSAGDAVLLMGREWEDCHIGDSHRDGHIHAAVHKSPTLDPFEGRVLLVVDVIPQ